jgi:hypothetical protein
MIVQILFVILFEFNLDEPVAYFPLEVNNYWEYIQYDCSLYDRINGRFFDTSRIDTIHSYIVKDSTINDHSWYYQSNAILPLLEYGLEISDVWLSFINDSLIVKTANFNNILFIIPFKCIYDVIKRNDMNSIDNCWINVKTRNNDFRSFALGYYSNDYFSDHISVCQNKDCWGFTDNSWWWYPLSLISILPGNDHENVSFCPNIGLVKFEDWGNSGECETVCLLHAKINGVYFDNPINISPTTWLDIKQEK